MSERTFVPTGRTIAFGRFRLLPAQQRLLDGDATVAVGSRALDILLALVERAGDLVSKEDLIARVWPDTFVEENNLRVHMAALRRALHDGQDGNRFVATIPGRGYQFVAPVTVSDTAPATGPAVAPAPPATTDEPARTLPFPLVRMVGRESVIGTLSAQLPQRRFVTLVGPGGIGKTTVAVAIARETASSHRDGIAFVDLGPVGDPALVSSALAAVLGLAVNSGDALPGVIAFLRQKRMLIVLDSCEHVVEAAAVTAEEVFNGAPGVQILATSREPLRVTGERVHRLSALESPSSSSGLTAAEALEFPSVQLFVERAAASLDGYSLGDADAPVVADICRRLDGIALAIELAAGHVAAFGVRELAARLDDRFRLLMMGRRTALARHQTLGATLDWSYQLLPVGERMLLRHLAVFAGDFFLEAAVAMAPGLPGSQVIDHVADLVSKSLLVADLRGGTVHYRLLDTTRLYGLEKLKADGEHRQAAGLHAAYCQRYFARADPESDRLTKAEWLARFVGRIDNLRAALEWAFSPDGDPAIGVGLTLAAVPIWVELSLTAECRTWVERALAHLGGDDPDEPRLRMQLSAALGWSRLFGADPTHETRQAWAATLALADALGDADYRSRALWGLWVDQLNSGALRKALEIAHQFAAATANSAEPIDGLMANRMLATSLHFIGEQAKARAHIERLLTGYVAPTRRAQISRFQFDQRVTARYFHARILWLQGFADQALRVVVGNVAEAQALGHALSLGSVLGQGACPVALFAGDLDGAERYGTMLLDHSEHYTLRLWHTWARCFMGLVMVRRGEMAAGLQSLRGALSDAAGTRYLPRYLFLVAELAIGLGQIGEVAFGLKTVEETLARCERTEDQWYFAELLRIRGELLLLDGGAGAHAAAEEDFRRAIDWGYRQGALAWELRAATSLARLRRIQGRDGEAREHLATVLARFSEGFATGDLVAAERLMAELA